ncbi:zinc ribbon domain-containing protein [Nocardia sp. NRRL S-836]|uniref:zinc ribbon domain-containing protein n=1 Tax=Nocardia sp. NRRL S-836 TaxID=1519492 RepID=UPI0006AE42E8|nr:zinc ribbon domain-containing protein [Nocardia sp. NRRL S-836]KOV85026.1 hypothetical protein ADL03_11875 [Nocardia sp. NRRL S-836]
MNLLKTERIVHHTVPDLGPVAQRIMQHFAGAQYVVAGQPRATPQHPGYAMPPAWEISLHAPSFRQIGQHRGAVKLELVPHAGITLIRVSPGVFGMPVGSEQLTWAVKLGQLWREIKQSELHDNALLVSEEYVTEAALRAGPAPQMPPMLPQAQPSFASPPGEPAWAVTPQPLQQDTAFCPGCGGRVAVTARFCPECGAKRG